MSKLKETLKEIAKTLKFSEEDIKKIDEKQEEKKEEAQEEKFVDATLESGEMIVIEPELVEGAAVVLKVEGGDPLPAPDGEHKLSDGVVIVTVDGKITEIRQPEELQEQEQEMSDEEDKKDIRKVIESIETHYKAEIAKLQESFDAQKKEFDEYKKQTEEKFAKVSEERENADKELFKAINAVAEMPAKEPEQKKKDGFKAINPKPKNIFLKNNKNK